MRVLCLVILVILTTCSDVRASEYPDIQGVEFIRNYDGDTITVNIKGWPDIIGKNISVRVLGVDTPEIRGECANEKAVALIAKYFVKKELTQANKIDIVSVSRGKYFRIVGDVVYDGKSLSEELISNGYGTPYDGGTKVNSWCDSEK